VSGLRKSSCVPTSRADNCQMKRSCRGGARQRLDEHTLSMGTTAEPKWSSDAEASGSRCEAVDGEHGGTHRTCVLTFFASPGTRSVYTSFVVYCKGARTERFTSKVSLPG
jgi:hypothetical protein